MKFLVSQKKNLNCFYTKREHQTEKGPKKRVQVRITFIIIIFLNEKKGR